MTRDTCPQTPRPVSIGQQDRTPLPLGGVSVRPLSTAVHPMLPVDAAWQPIAHYPRHPMVTCSGCRDRQVNESNVLRRHGWLETIATPRQHLCGLCAETHAARDRIHNNPKEDPR